MWENFYPTQIPFSNTMLKSILIPVLGLTSTCIMIPLNHSEYKTVADSVVRSQGQPYHITCNDITHMDINFLYTQTWIPYK